MKELTFTALVHLVFALARHDQRVTLFDFSDLDFETRFGIDSLGSAAWASTEAERLLTANSWRWANTRQVAEHARWAANGIRPEDQDLLVAAAYLHDIGNSDAIAETGHPGVDGARHLHRLGLFELACLVAHHTSARPSSTAVSAAKYLAPFPRPSRPLADALTYSILTSGPVVEGSDGRGHPGVETIEYPATGIDTLAASSRTEHQAAIGIAVGRTLRRASRAKPPLKPLCVTPVVLGCSTLVRFHGVLDVTTAAQATHTLSAVAGGHPHSVVLDLAFVTGMDLSGARCLDGSGPLSGEAVSLTFLDPRARDCSMLERVRPPWSKPPIVYGIDAAMTPHCP